MMISVTLVWSSCPILEGSASCWGGREVFAPCPGPQQWGKPEASGLARMATSTLQACSFKPEFRGMQRVSETLAFLGIMRESGSGSKQS